jgi:DNA polymerase III subunit epsilon
MQKLPTLTFLDVETTGLSPYYKDRICEVGILRCEAPDKHISFNTLVNPRRQISPGASAVNKITDEMVQDAPYFKDISKKILELLDNCVLVCHNAPFDISFINFELENCGIRPLNFSVIDTLIIARRFFTFPSNCLSNIASTLNLDVTSKHRAMADVHTTRKVFDHFWAELNKKGITNIEEIFSHNINNRNAGTAEKKFHLPPLIEEAIKSEKNILLHYVSAIGHQTKRVIKPLRVIKNFDYFYLEAFCSLRNDKRTFRLDRIVNLQIQSQ